MSPAPCKVGCRSQGALVLANLEAAQNRRADIAWRASRWICVERPPFSRLVCSVLGSCLCRKFSAGSSPARRIAGLWAHQVSMPRYEKRALTAIEGSA